MKIVIVLAVLLLAGALTFAAASIATSGQLQVQSVTASSACPATGCDNGECHSQDNVPEPDGVTELQCPKSDCSSADCHAWGSLTGRSQASDASLNLWVMMPALIVAAAVVLARRRR